MLTRVLKILGEVILIAVVLAAIVLGMVRALFPYVDRYRPVFEQWGSAALHQPVKIDKVTAVWQGFYPEFLLDNVRVFDTQNQHVLLQVKRLQVGVNLLDSLFTKRFVPSALSVAGTHLLVKQVDTQTIAVNSLNFHVADHTAQNSDIPGILIWLLNQGDIQFKHVDLDWQDISGRIFQFTDVTLQFDKGFFHHRVIGLATLLAQTPTRFRFVINLNEVGPNKQNVQADLYLYIRNFDMTPWLQKYQWHNFAITAGHLERLQLWASWQDNHWQQLQTVVKLKQAVVSIPAQTKTSAIPAEDSGNCFLVLKRRKNQVFACCQGEESRFSPLTTPHRNCSAGTAAKTLHIDQLSANIGWRPSHNGFTIAADQVQLTLNQHAWPFTQFSFWQHAANKKSPVIQTYAVDQLDFAQLQQLLTDFNWLPAAAQTPLSALQPQATLHDVLVRRELTANDNANISARFTLENLQTVAWQHIPAINGLSAQIQLTPTAGTLQLISTPLQLDFGELFGHVLELDDEIGTVQWLQREDGWKIQVSNLQLANDDLGIRTQLSLLLPFDGQTPFMELLGSFVERDSSQIRHYIPVGILHPALAQWLQDAFVAGAGADGQILLQGPLSHFPFDDHTGHFEINAQVHAMDFNYRTGWPMLSGLDATLLFNDRSLDIQASKAAIMGLPTGSIHGVISDLAHAQLNVEGKIQANTQDGLNFIAQSPLHASLGGVLDNLSMQGPMQLNLALQIPFYADSGSTTVQGQVTMLPGTLSIPVWGIQFTDVSGDFQFTQDSLTAQKLAAKWLGAPVNINIATDPAHTIRAQLSGHLLLNTLKKQYAFGSLQDKLQGETDYVATLLLSKKQDKTQTALMVDSDLKGVAINLPAPLKKTASDQIPTHFQIDFITNNAINLSVQYAKRVSAIISLAKNQTKKWLFNSGNVRFGAEPASLQTTPGLLIDGKLQQFIWSDIADYLQPLFAATSAAKNAMTIPIRKLDLSIDKIAALGLNISAATIQAQAQTNRWDVQINSPLMVGTLQIPKNLSQQAIVGDFSQFHFTPGASNNVSGLNPANIPALNLTFHNFYYGDKPFGEIALVTLPMNNGLQIQTLSAVQGKTQVITTGRWQRLTKGREQTTLSGTLKSGDIGSALKAWGITGSIIDGTGNAAFALSWPAAPYNFTLAQVNGSFSNVFSRGRIINISQGSETEMGIGRILNLFSLQSIARRLSLDFSDLLEKGFSFDTMKGDFTIQNGNAMTNNVLLEGPVARIDVKGRIGLGAKDYDLTMRVTPYVTSSLPLAATLVGGPIAGAATWLGSKVLNGVVDKITQQSYQVKGTWDNPAITKLAG